jgi:uncharacterized protein YndB with AHSA1/START domain
VPTARRSRTIAAPVQELWDLVCDPHHLPRWWPRVTRVEDVEDGAFTEVMKTKKGKLVRADFNVIRVDESQHLLTWSQQLEGTPFARVLSSAETDVRLTPATPRSESGSAREHAGDSAATEVAIELRQSLAGYSARYGMLAGLAPRLGGRMVRRAAQATLDEALDGLQRISG